jgi:hypothetical protein
MAVTVITVTRESTRFVAKMEEIPPDAIVRMEGQHWDKPSKV